MLVILFYVLHCFIFLLLVFLLLFIFLFETLNRRYVFRFMNHILDDDEVAIAMALEEMEQEQQPILFQDDWGNGWQDAPDHGGQEEWNDGVDEEWQNTWNRIDGATFPLDEVEFQFEANTFAHMWKNNGWTYFQRSLDYFRLHGDIYQTCGGEMDSVKLLAQMAAWSTISPSDLRQWFGFDFGNGKKLNVINIDKILKHPGMGWKFARGIGIATQIIGLGRNVLSVRTVGLPPNFSVDIGDLQSHRMNKKIKDLRYSEFDRTMLRAAVLIKRITCIEKAREGLELVEFMSEEIQIREFTIIPSNIQNLILYSTDLIIKKNGRDYYCARITDMSAECFVLRPIHSPYQETRLEISRHSTLVPRVFQFGDAFVIMKIPHKFDRCYEPLDIDGELSQLFFEKPEFAQCFCEQRTTNMFRFYYDFYEQADANKLPNFCSSCGASLQPDYRNWARIAHDPYRREWYQGSVRTGNSAGALLLDQSLLNRDWRQYFDRYSHKRTAPVCSNGVRTGVDEVDFGELTQCGMLDKLSHIGLNAETRSLIEKITSTLEKATSTLSTATNKETHQDSAKAVADEFEGSSKRIVNYVFDQLKDFLKTMSITVVCFIFLAVLFYWVSKSKITAALAAALITAWGVLFGSELCNLAGWAMFWIKAKLDGKTLSQAVLETKPTGDRPPLKREWSGDLNDEPSFYVNENCDYNNSPITQTAGWENIDISSTKVGSDGILSWTSILMTCLFGAMSILVIKALPSDKDTEGFLKRCATFPRAIKGVKEMIELFSETTDWCQKFFNVKIMGQNPVVAMDGGITEIQEWAEKIKKYTSVEYFDKISTSMMHAQEVCSLYHQGMGFCRNKHMYSPKAKEILTSCLATAKTLWNKGIASIARTQSSRPKPPCLVLWGDTSVGKTGMVNAITLDMLKELKVTSKMIQENGIACYRYNRDVDQEFWDGYKDQPIILYDDGLQKRDSVANPSLEITEYIHGINMFARPLHMAAIEDKQNTTLQARAFIITSNASKIQAESIVCPAAVASRFSHVFLVRIKPEFVKLKNGSPRLDADKALAATKAPINLNIYDLEECDINIDGQFVPNGRHINYFELAREMRAAVSKALATNQDMDQFLEDYMTMDGDVELQYSQKYNNPQQTGFGSWLAHKTLNMFGYSDEDIIESVANAQEYLGMESYSQSPVSQQDEEFVEASPKIGGIKFVRNDGGDVEFMYDEDLDQIWENPTRAEKIRAYLANRMNRVMLTFADYWNSIKSWAESHPMTTTLLAITGFLGMVSLLWKFWKSDRVVHKLINEPVDIQLPNPALDSHLPALAAALKAGMTVEGHYFVRIGGQSHAHNNWDEVEWALEKEDIPEGSTLITPIELMQCSSHAKKDQRVQRLKLRSGSQARKDARMQRARMRGANPIVSTKGSQDSWNTFFTEFGMYPEDLADMLFMSEKDDMKFFAFDDECGLDFVMPENVTFKTPDGKFYVCPIQRGFECENLSAKIIRNMSVLGMVTPEGQTRTVGNVLFIQGTIALIPYHYVTTLSAMKDEIKVFIRPIKSDKKIWVDRKNFFGGTRLGPNGHQHDAYLFDAGVQHPQRRTLLKTWMSIRDFDKIDNQQARLITRSVTDVIEDEVITYKDGLADTITLNRTLECGTTFADEFETGRKPESITYRNMVVSDHIKVFPTQCGSPLLIDNDLVKGKICGILNLSLGTGARSSGYAPVALEDLENGLKHFKSVHSKIYPGDAKEVDESVITPIPLQCSFLQEGAAQPIASNRVSAIVRTKIFNQVWEATNRPAALHRTFDPDTDPMYKGLEKCTVEVPLIDEQVLSIAAEDYGNVIMTHHHPSSAPNKFQEVLDFETAVTGKPGVPYFEAINRSTSPGFPWVHHRPAKLPGKRAWLGDDEDFKLDSIPAQHLKIVCQEVVDLAKEGIRDTIIFSDTLKDEVRANEKVDALKTRVFAAGPMHFTIPCRQYFLPFSAYLQSNRIRNGIAVGINPYDPEWHELASYINVHPNVIAGDFSNYDGSIPSQVLTAAFDIVINKFYYESSEEDKMVRATIAAMVTRSEHLCDGIVYQWDHSLPSGNPLTAIMNSIVNNIVIRMAWLSETGRPISQFNKHVYMIAFGDDNVISVSNEMISEFNFPVIAEGLRKLGMTMTDERKTGEIILFRELKDVQFLKRGFLFREDIQRYVAPLDIESIMKMTNWIHKTPCPDQVLASNIETIWRELSLHPKDIFDKWTSAISRVTPACVLQRALVEPTYDAYTRLWISGKIDKEGIWFCSGELQQVSGNQESLSTEPLVVYYSEAERTAWLYLQNNKPTTSGSPVTNGKRPSPKRFGRRTRRNNLWPATQTMMNAVATPVETAVADELAERPAEQTTHSGPSEQTIEVPNAAGASPLNVDAQEMVHITESTNRISSGYVKNPRNPAQLGAMLDTSVKDYTEQSIKTFLQTAVEIGNFSWTTSTPQILSFTQPTYTGATPVGPGGPSPYLFRYEFPQDLLQGHKEIADKLNYMSMLRCDFVVRVVLNVQPFQSGGLRMFGLPLPNMTATKSLNLASGPMTTLTSIPGQTLNIFNTQSVEFRMKPVGPFLFYDLVENSHTWWEFNLACLSVLGDPTGTGKVEGTVYAYLDNVDLRFRTGAPNGIQPSRLFDKRTVIEKEHLRYGALKERRDRMKKKKEDSLESSELIQCMEAEKNAKTGTISGVCNTIESVAGIASMIPGVGQFAQLACSAAEAVGGIAKQFGASKPTTTVNHLKVQPFSGSSFLATDGEFVGHTLATIERNSLDPMAGAGLEGLDEGSFMYIAKQPAILDSFVWHTSDTPATQLYSLTPGPKEMWVGNTDNGKAVSFPPYVLALSPFMLYNCSWRVQFEAFKAGPHSGKLELIYVPRHFGALSSVNTNACLKWVWDLKDAATFDIILPFVDNTQWLRNPTFEQQINGEFNTSDVSPGTLYVRVLNTLTTPAVCAPQINITVCLMPDNDLVLGGGLSAPQLIPMALASGFVEKLTTDEIDNNPITQCGSIGQTNYMSNERIINKIDLKVASKTANATTTGEQILSVHALVKRFMPNLTYGTSSDANDSFRIQPNCATYAVFGTFSGVAQQKDWINIFQSIYNFRRGGMRVNYTVQPAHNTDGSGQNIKWFTRMIASNFLTQSEDHAYAGWVHVFGSNSDINVGEMCGEVPIYGFIEGVQSVEVPFYSRYHVLINTWTDGVNPLNGSSNSVELAWIPDNEAILFVADVPASSDKPVLDTRFYRAARDDFQFSTYSGMPVFIYDNYRIMES